MFPNSQTFNEPNAISNPPNQLIQNAKRKRLNNSFREAIIDLNTLLNLSPENAAFLSERGECYRRLGHLEEALKDFDASIAIDPNCEFAFLCRAQVNLSLKQFSKAIADCDSALKFIKVSTRNYSYALNVRQKAKIGIGDLQGAIMDAKNSLPRPIDSDVPYIPYDELNFTNKKMLGEGGYGKVFNALWKEQPVAVKSCSRAFFHIKEALIQSSLHHDNIAKCYGISCSGDSYYLIIELLDCSLSALFTDEPSLPVAIKLSISLDLIKAFIYIAEQRIVHGDLKPSNIALIKNTRNTYKAKIIDFGLSEIMTQMDACTTSRAGTPKYSAPELLAETSTMSYRTDVYSLGLLLWSVFSGKKRFCDVSNKTYKQKVMAGERPEITEDTPAPLAKLLLSCWAQDPNARPKVEALKATQDEIERYRWI